MMASLPLKVVFIILLAGTILLNVLAIYDYLRYENQRKNLSVNFGLETSEHIVQNVNEILEDIEEKAFQIADSLSNTHYPEQELLDLIREESRSMQSIQGITVAFEPYMYRDDRRLFAPYFDKMQNQMIFIEDVYNYTNENLPGSQWYTLVKDRGARWIEPYFAQGAQTLVADFGVPFYQNTDSGRSQIAGTVTMTISLEQLTNLITSLSIGQTGYGFVISKRGNYLTHPVNEYIAEKNILDVALEHNDPVLDNVAKNMMSGKSGYEEFLNRISNQVSYVFYGNIPRSNWSMGIVFIKNELLGSPVMKRKKLMHIGFSLSLLLIITLSFPMKIYRWQEKHMWRLSVILSSTIILNIAFLWILTYTLRYSDEADDDVRISSETELKRFIKIEDTRKSQHNQSTAVKIPTGLFINEIEFRDSYNVNISGRIWQKYDDNISTDLKRSVYFPQMAPFAESFIIEEKDRRQENGSEIITWDFRTTLKLDFDYSTYPFDFRMLELHIAHPDYHKDILLVPDLESYRIMNPTTRPGINTRLVMPSSEIVSSFFDYKFLGYNTNFGGGSFKGIDTVPSLFFNVTLKRRFINAFVSNIIPILVIALMVYFVVYSSAKKRKLQRSGISSLGVVESSAAFFFVLMLAHIDLRKTVNTPEITYMEYFYFIMYLILALVVFNIVLFTRRDNYLFFDYKDNLIVKLTYWPVFLGMCLVVTLIRFY